MMRNHGQGALEYLLLIAGAVLVAIIVFLLLFSFAPVGGDVLTNSIDEYEKIDLCTGMGADCSFFLNWSGGLSGSTKGFVLENKSSWRTLYVNGITLQLLCGDHVCPDTFLNEPSTTIEWPVASGGAGPACSSAAGIVTCTPCDVDTQNCYTTTIPFCPNPAVEGEDCVNPIPFGGAYAITLPPGIAGLKAGVGVAPPANAQNLSGIQYQFHVAQLSASGIKNQGVDTKAPGLFWFSSLPDNSGTQFFCEKPSAAGLYAPQYGCTLNPGCALTNCELHDGSSDAVDTYCAVNNLDPTSIVCVDDSVISTPTCLNTNFQSYNPGYYELTSTTGIAAHLDVSPFKNVADYVSSIPRGLNVEVPGFNPPGCDTNPSICMSACSSLIQPLELVQLSKPIDDSQICGRFNFSPTSLGTVSGIPFGYYDSTQGKAHCLGIYDYSSSSLTLFPAMQTAAGIGNGDFYLGIRTTSASMNIESPYPLSGIATYTIPAIRALFYPK